MIIPEEQVADMLPLLVPLRGMIFTLTISPADVEKEPPPSADEDSSFMVTSLASISSSSRAIQISGKGGMSVTFDLPGAATQLRELLRLREQMLKLEIGEA